MDAEIARITSKGSQGHSALDANFTIAQALKTGAALTNIENAVDINIDKFSIAAWWGPMVMARQLCSGILGTGLCSQIPPNIDVLYREQEVGADARSALTTVLDAEEQRTQLLAEAKALEKEQKRGKVVSFKISDKQKTERLEQEKMAEEFNLKWSNNICPVGRRWIMMRRLQGRREWRKRWTTSSMTPALTWSWR